MKIMLINPPLLEPADLKEREVRYAHWIRAGNMYIKPFEPPLGIASIARVLKDNHLDVEIVDGTGEMLTRKDVLERVDDSAPRIVGISCLTPNYPSGLSIAREIKKRYPRIFLVMGGVHPTVFPHEVYEETGADAVVTGEGEKGFLRLVSELKQGTEPRGVIFIRKLLNNREIPFPEYSLLPAENYISYTGQLRKLRALPVMVTRGCPYHCSFCAVHSTMGKRWRAMEPHRAAEEIASLVERYNLEGVWFKDSILNLNRKWIEEFSSELNNLAPGLKWQMNTRVDLVRKDEIEMLVQRGLVQVDLGIETGTDKSLKVLKKGITVEQIARAVKILKDYVKVAGFFMIGIPGETEDDIWQTVRLAQELELDACSWSLCQPRPGSELFALVADEVRNRAVEWHRLVFTDTPRSWCHVPDERLIEIYHSVNNMFNR